MPETSFPLLRFGFLSVDFRAICGCYGRMVEGLVKMVWLCGSESLICGTDDVGDVCLRVYEFVVLGKG